MGQLDIKLTYNPTDARIQSLLYKYPSSVARKETLIALSNLITELNGGGHTLLSGVQTLGGVSASGTVTFAGQPSANDTITINSRVWTFVASGATQYQVNIGGTLAATLANFISQYNASKLSTANISNITATATSTVITFTADWGGLWGNLITLAKSGTNLTVSGANLAGGTAPTSQYTF